MQSMSFSFQYVPAVFKRKHHVLLAIFDDDNRLYLARKHVYPSNIYRLFGGGVDDGELAIDAAIREMKEETGLTTIPELKESFSFLFDETSTQTTFHMQFDLFYVFIHNLRVNPSDDVQGMRIFSKEDVPTLMTDMSELSKEIVVGKSQEKFSWNDWGTIFVILHQYVFDHWPVN